MSARSAATLVLLIALVGGPQTAAGPPAAKSAECMACHDGSGAVEIRSHVSHRVEIDYEATRARSTAALKPASATTAFGGSIRDTLLIDGRVECSTCHDMSRL